ncbi:ABC transporter ATP-binding protein [Georgenia sp. 10Sc9-8]|uniref:ABC transporter ATP-binding protein n=1 Tax=Georgenia halotolerans TaxID=3028317 RepID=A0ABT5TX75_9MICO|nr:ABC transporter ATP-binding protein [Georgenia halotolerans]
MGRDPAPATDIKKSPVGGTATDDGGWPVVEAVAASGLTKCFGGREAVSELTFSVAPGRAFGLLGPNGAGKTTTVRMLTGLLTPSSGSVTLFGEKLTADDAHTLRARIGVQTDTNLYEALSVRENLRAWGALYGLAAPALVRRTAEILAVLGLADRADSLVGELSKGMRQKLSVGRAILHEPELVFLDEPTAGLDPEAAVELTKYLKEMVSGLRTTVIICTHQLHGLESLCDGVGILKGGRLVVAGDVHRLLSQRWPRRRYLIAVAGDLAVAKRAVSAVVGDAVHGAGDDVLDVSLDEEGTISSVVEALVRQRVPVRAVVPQHPTLQDLYFSAIEDHT